MKSGVLSSGLDSCLSSQGTRSLRATSNLIWQPGRFPEYERIKRISLKLHRWSNPFSFASAFEVASSSRPRLFFAKHKKCRSSCSILGEDSISCAIHLFGLAHYTLFLPTSQPLPLPFRIFDFVFEASLQRGKRLQLDESSLLRFDLEQFLVKIWSVLIWSWSEASDDVNYKESELKDVMRSVGCGWQLRHVDSLSVAGIVILGATSLPVTPFSFSPDYESHLSSFAVASAIEHVWPSRGSRICCFIHTNLINIIDGFGSRTSPSDDENHRKGFSWRHRRARWAERIFDVLETDEVVEMSAACCWRKQLTVEKLFFGGLVSVFACFDNNLHEKQ